MAYPQGVGYVLDFSNSTISEFFEDEFGINFDDPKYLDRGTSKRNRLIALILNEGAYIVANVLRSLWDRREGLVRRRGDVTDNPAEDEAKRKFLELIANVDGALEFPRADALDRYERDRTLDELIADIERDLRENKPEAALDHLHTYCVKKFTHLLKVRGVECDRDEALHSRFGKYRQKLLVERALSSFTDRALKSGISLFESYNDIRNNHSFAHDNPILDPAEARYVFDSISALLIFLRAVEAGRYEA